MTKRPIRLGELLVQMGRVTPEQIDRALAHQREHGGYMGDSLVTLGILSREELWWGLADQHEIPFVHLKPEHIDHALAARVPADWARENGLLPVLWDEGRATVVTRQVPDPGKLEEVRALVGASEIVPALASPESIAELIQAVHGPAGPLSLRGLLEEAMRLGGSAFGISARPEHAVAWYRAAHPVSRVLEPGWRAELQALVAPPLPADPRGGIAAWRATALLGSEILALDCTAAAAGDALEWGAAVRDRVKADPARVHVDPELVQRARDAREEDGLAARITCEPGAERAAEALLSVLPAHLLGPAARTVHLADGPGGTPPGVLALALTGPAADVAAGLEPFHLDAVTAAVAEVDDDGLDALRRAAPFVAVLATAGAAAAARFDCDVRFALTERGPAWTLTLPR